MSFNNNTRTKTNPFWPLIHKYYRSVGIFLKHKKKQQTEGKESAKKCLRKIIRFFFINSNPCLYFIQNPHVIFPFITSFVESNY